MIDNIHQRRKNALAWVAGYAEAALLKDGDKVAGPGASADRIRELRFNLRMVLRAARLEHVPGLDADQGGAELPLPGNGEAG